MRKKLKNHKSILIFILATLGFVYLGASTIYIIFSALGHGLNIDSYAANGTFQLYNPLRRLLNGEVIARDFPFFHGVGVPLLHFPVFHLLGHNIFAAEVAKWLISPLFFLGSSLAIFFTIFRRLKTTVIAASLFTILAFYCIDVIWPGNSLVGLRTTFPFLTAAFILWNPQWHFRARIRGKTRNIQLYRPALYTLMGVSVACGTEQGLALVVAYILITAYHRFRNRQNSYRWIIPSLAEAIYITIATYIVLSILTLGHAHEALHYALIDVAKDQGWYFGAPPNSILHWNTLSHFFKTRMFYVLPVIIAGLIAFIAGIRKRLFHDREQFVFSLILLYGAIVFVVSATGYWAPTVQLIPLERASGIILIAAVVRLFISIHQTSSGGQLSAANLRHRGTAVALIITILLLGFHGFTMLRSIHWLPVRKIITETRRARHADDNTYISRAWRKRVAAFEPHIRPGATIWSTYTSVYDSLRGQYNTSPGGEDYIIHALGPERRKRYAEAFMQQRPDYVITLLPKYFIYEEWLWTRHWPFYQFLQDNYTIVTSNGSHILWRRDDPRPNGPDETPLRHARQQGGKYYINNDTSETKVYKVLISYRATSVIPLTKKVPRYLLTMRGSSLQGYPISLPPYETSWEFPIILGPNDRSAELTPATYGLLPGASLDVLDISYRDVTPKRDNLLLYHKPSR